MGMPPAASPFFALSIAACKNGSMFLTPIQLFLVSLSELKLTRKGESSFGSWLEHLQQFFNQTNEFEAKRKNATGD